MRPILRSSRFGMLLSLPVIISLPLLMGQGCPGTNGLIPVTPSGRSSTDLNGSTNASPIFAFIEPSTDISAQVGQIIPITWTDSDPDNNAAITLLADPDNVLGNGNERVILALALEDDPTNAFNLDTSSLPPATYRLIAKVNDGVNPELIVVASGRLLLLGQGFNTGNKSPVITMTDPEGNLSVAQGDTLDLGYCGRDVDGGLSGVVADIVLILDTDEDPENDLDLTGAASEVNFLEACSAGGFPRPVGGVIVVGCAKDDGCVFDPASGFINRTVFPISIDVAQIPPRTGGEPYWPRVTMWDHTNRPVHSYSRGNLSVTRLGAGTIDLGQVGRSITGSMFYGFDAGGLAGSTATTLGDLDGDGVDDIVVVSRYGRGYETPGNVGTAHVIMGRPGEKFGSEIALNAITTLYRGSMLVMPGTTDTFGITSVCRFSDVDGDGHPDVGFGLPYVEVLSDNLADDVHDCGCPEGGPYQDLFPNPWTAADECDPKVGNEIGNTDSRESGTATNDLDLTTATPINGGYVIVVSSRNPISGSDPTNTIQFLGIVRDLSAMGQSRTGATPFGARFRGGWYDAQDMTQNIRPYSIIPDNLFGQTVASMPQMVNSNIDTPQGYGPEMLTSSPLAYRGRGAVFYSVVNDWTRFNGGGSQSFPYYTPEGGCPPDQLPVRVPTFPAYEAIVGKAVGDHLGYASSASDYNLDGNQDILMGAPGAERQGIAQRGIVYVLFGRPDFPLATDLDLQVYNPPRMEIWGINANDQFGFMQTLVGDVNHDSVPDIGFSSEYFDGPSGVDSGAIYVIFGGRRLTGENIFTVNQVGTAQLPGFKIYGTQPGAHSGAVINNAGDFNGDGTDDLLVCAPNEIRAVDGQNRRGVGYVIFGGPHLNGQTFNLAQVGTSALPGVVLISPFAVGSADEAPIDWISTAGDMNGDGFADLLVGVSTADFVNPLEPTQRRIDAGQMYLIYGSNTGSNALGS